MKQKKKKKGIGKVQGYALLYGRSSKAIRIVNGERVGMGDDKKRGPRAVRIVSGKVERSVEKKPRLPKIKSVVVKQVQKKYRMSEEAKKRLDNLQDPLDMMSRNARTQKYEAAKSKEEYEYGLSDW